jgi:hypothetical protein
MRAGKSMSIVLLFIAISIVSLHCEKLLGSKPTSSAKDYRDYAPIAVGTEWKYVRKDSSFSDHMFSTTGSNECTGPTESRVDSIMFTIVDSFMLDGNPSYAILTKEKVVDTTRFWCNVGGDSVIVKDDSGSRKDTCTIKNDSVVVLNNSTDLQPFLILKDYPDSSKHDCTYMGNKYKIAKIFDMYGGGYDDYMDTYGLVHWEYNFLGNGDGFRQSIDLVEFNGKSFDVNAISGL